MRAIAAAREAVTRDPQALEAAWVLARALALPGERRRLVQRLAEVSVQRPFSDPAIVDTVFDKAILIAGAGRTQRGRELIAAAVASALATAAPVYAQQAAATPEDVVLLREIRDALKK